MFFSVSCTATIFTANKDY